MFPNATFSNSPGYAPPAPGVHSLPPTVGQPPRQVPSFGGSQPSPTVAPPASGAPPPAARAPSTDSGMGASNNSTPTNLSGEQASPAQPGVWDIFEKEIAEFAEQCDGDDKDKDDSKAGIKILKPMELNEKAKELQGQTITVKDGARTVSMPKRSESSDVMRQNQVTSTVTSSVVTTGPRTVIVQQPNGTPTKPGQIMVQVSGAQGGTTSKISVQAPLVGPGGVTPTKLVVQSPVSGLQMQGVPGGPRMVMTGPPTSDGKVTYLYPLNNRLQGQQNVTTTVIRLSTPMGSPLTTVAGSTSSVTVPGSQPQPTMTVSGTAGLGVRLPTPSITSTTTAATPVGIQPGQSIVVASGIAPPAPSPTVRPPVSQPGTPTTPQPGVRPVRPVRGRGGTPVRMRGQIRPTMRPRMPMRAGAPGARGVRPGGPRGVPPRGMRPRGPRPPGMVRPGGAPRPAAPSASTNSTPPVTTPSSTPSPSPRKEPTLKPSNSVKVEVVDLSDDDDSPPPAPRNATLDKLQACGISVSRQKAPQVPKGLKLPPGISLSPAPTGYSAGASKRPSTASVGGSAASSSSSSYSITTANEEPASKKVALPEAVVGALTSGGTSGPKKKVELELSDKQMDALKALGLL